MPGMEADRLTMIFGAQANDPLFYDVYEITPNLGQHFPEIKFDFKQYDYFVVCYRELTGRELEILTINRYFQKDKAKRFVKFVLNDKTRPKFISTLAHLKYLDDSKFKNVEKAAKAHILKMVLDRKFNKCYVISENKHIDQKYMDAENALNAIVGYGMGTILVWGDAGMVYYEGEEMGDRRISISL